MQKEPALIFWTLSDPCIGSSHKNTGTCLAEIYFAEAFNTVLQTIRTFCFFPSTVTTVYCFVKWRRIIFDRNCTFNLAKCRFVLRLIRRRIFSRSHLYR